MTGSWRPAERIGYCPHRAAPVLVWTPGPGRVGGGIVAICATLVLLAVPWLRTDRCRLKPVLLWFGIACVLSAVTALRSREPAMFDAGSFIQSAE